MPFVDTNRLKGNYASNLVSLWLSKICLVRPVAEGTDIGIDLFCESLAENTPFGHFWVQVKTIPMGNISKGSEGQVAWFDFETRHLQYWQRQPIPVYVFLVPIDTWPATFPKEIFVICMSRYLIRSGVPKQATIRIKSDGSFEYDILDEDLKLFITKIVPWDTQALLLQQGIAAPLSNLSQTLEDIFPAAIGFGHLEKMRKAIIDTAVVGLLNSLIVEKIKPEFRKLRHDFEMVVSSFYPFLSPLGISALINAAQADGNLERARAMVNEVIMKTQNNTSLDDDTRSKLITQWEELLKDLV